MGFGGGGWGEGRCEMKLGREGWGGEGGGVYRKPVEKRVKIDCCEQEAGSDCISGDP